MWSIGAGAIEAEPRSASARFGDNLAGRATTLRSGHQAQDT